MDVFESKVLSALAKLVSEGKVQSEKMADEILVLKKCKMVVRTGDIKIGDQIEIELKYLGTFTATAHDITDKGVLFIFDDCVARRQMNDTCTNNGSYKKSDLYKWINTTLLDAFPEDIRKRITDITIPTYGQMFGHDDWYRNSFEEDNSERLPLMSIRKNRIATCDNDACWYWLKNATKKSVSSEYFASVDPIGRAASTDADDECGVRPIFWLV